MRRRSKGTGGSLDSLLDTMTNVVGILVIMLVVTQLGVSEAVKEIGKENPVDPEILAEARRRAEHARAEHERLEKVLALYRTDDPAEFRQELGRLQKKIEATESDLKHETEVNQREAMIAAQSLKKLREAYEKKVEELRKKEEQLRATLNELLDQLASLKALLADTPQPVAAKARTVVLPNPRAAPEGAQPLYFLCRGERLTFVNVREAQRRVQLFSNAMVTRGRLNRDPKKGIDCAKIAESLKRARMVEGDFYLRLASPTRYPYIVFERKPNHGESVAEIQQSSSEFQQGLRRVDPDRFYLRFVVWPDGYDTYLVARRIATEQGLLAGWQPTGMSGEYRVRLEGKLRCGPPPPPKPKPPPGQPPPKPVPPRPKDDID
jgi:hypothetical protein